MKRRILDNLHGLVYLNDIEWDIINTPQFQRLRHIKQLGVAHLVFPGAQHTRFSHSLGVLRLTEKVFWNIERTNRDLYNSKQLDKHKTKLRLAALLHDIGHYPLSHTLESAYQSFADFEDKQREEANERFSLFNKNELSPSENYPSMKDMHHEHIGKWTIENCPEIKEKILLLYEYDQAELDDITDAIIGNLSAGHRFYSHILHSDIDVDTLDYCLRDSRAAGIEYGKYDINFLLDNVRLIVDKESQSPMLCFKKKSIHAIEHFLLAKHYYYLQIIYHPKRWFFEEAAKLFALNAIDIGWLPKPKKYKELLVHPEIGCGMTDHYFWHLLHKAYRNEKHVVEDGISEPTDEMNVLSKILIERRLPDTYWCSENIDKNDRQRDRDICEFDPDQFSFMGYNFIKNKYLADKNGNGGVFGRFSKSFKVTKTIGEYIIEHRRDLKLDDNQIVNPLVLRDPIRIRQSDDSFEFLSEQENTLAHSLAKQEIKVKVVFGSK